MLGIAVVGVKAENAWVKGLLDFGFRAGVCGCHELSRCVYCYNAS